MDVDKNVLARMREDWNSRAREDAKYYVAFGRRDQEDEEFFASAADVARSLAAELKRLKRRQRALEIGCGPGRLLRPMSVHFEEVHGVDVSDEMIRMAREKLRHTPNAFPHHTSGSDLALFPDEHFDFIYSYAVFQHIPSAEVVFSYLREACRVLRPGGILRCQLNGLPKTAAHYTTWEGVRISAEEVATFARESGLHLLALDGVSTQYMWTTCRKPARPRIQAISNANTGEAASPASGPFAAASLWIAGLPEDADLNSLTILFDGVPGRASYLGSPDHDGVCQLNVGLPAGIRTGLVPVEVAGVRGWFRVIPAGPTVPRLVAVGDGVNLCAGTTVSSGIIKATMEDVANPGVFCARVDELTVSNVESFCVDPLLAKYEFNFPLPEGTTRGPHNLWLSLGKRRLPPVGFEVV